MFCFKKDVDILRKKNKLYLVTTRTPLSPQGNSSVNLDRIHRYM